MFVPLSLSAVSISELFLTRRKVKSTAVTLRDVALESGVSPATVSIVLNNAPLSRYIPPTTKDRIERAANFRKSTPPPAIRLTRSALTSPDKASPK
jgi:LacI family transcriptional regulator